MLDNKLNIRFDFEKDISGIRIHDCNSGLYYYLNGGKWNKEEGLIFNDRYDYIDLKHPDLTSNWTLSMWLKVKHMDRPEYFDGDISSINQFEGEVAHVLSDITNNLIASHNCAIMLKQKDHGYSPVLYKFGKGEKVFDAVLPIDEWRVLTLVGNQNEVKLYVNGQYRESIKISMNCPMYRIGTGMKASLREVKILSQALKDEEINNITYRQFENKGSLSRGNKILLKHGIQTLVWIRSDQHNNPYPSKEEWEDSHFTGVTYYDTPMYNNTFQKMFPEVKWSMAAAPNGNTMWGTPIQSPTSQDHFLSQDQRQNINNLVSICFGDEEYYTEDRVGIFKQWFNISKRLYPNVIVHNNIYMNQWTEHQMRYFMRTARPDMLTFDTYYYHENAHDNEFNTIVDVTNNLRLIALEGHDGTGQSPIPFGQYLQGFKTGKRGALAGDYLITESQISLVAFINIGMGGKWMNFFRWEYNPDVFILFDKEGNKTDSYYQYVKVCKYINWLSPYLVRLTSTEIKVIPGYHNKNGIRVRNELPKTVQPVNWNLEEYLYGINAKNLGKNNDGLPGDVLIGYYKPLEGLEEMEKESVVSSNSRYFMVVNGLADATNGLGGENQQQINLLFKDIKWINKVNRNNGEAENIKLLEIDRGIYQYSFILDGGVGELFFI